MLLIVLTALLVNGVTVLHHATAEIPTSVGEHHIDAHDEPIRDDAKNAVCVSTPIDTRTPLSPQQSCQMAKLLCTAIFHPPQAR